MKLDLCGGKNPVGGSFLNVDIRMLPQVALVADVRRLPFGDGVIEAIFSDATLEHFTRRDVERILAEFYRILMPRARLTICVPDFRALSEAYLKGKITAQVANRYVFGAQEHPFDLHKGLFDFYGFKRLLEASGFKGIERQEYDRPLHMPALMLKIVCERDTSPPKDRARNKSAESHIPATHMGSTDMVEWANLLAEKDGRILQLQREFKERTAWAMQLDGELAKKEARILQLQQELEERTAWAMQLDGELAERNSRILQLQREFEERMAWAMQLDDKLAERNSRMLQLQRESKERTAWAKQLDGELTQLEQELTQLRKAWYHRLFGPQKMKRLGEALGRLWRRATSNSQRK